MSTNKTEKKSVLWLVPAIIGGFIFVANVLASNARGGVTPSSVNIMIVCSVVVGASIWSYLRK